MQIIYHHSEFKCVQCAWSVQLSGLKRCIMVKQVSWLSRRDNQLHGRTLRSQIGAHRLSWLQTVFVERSMHITRRRHSIRGFLLGIFRLFRMKDRSVSSRCRCLQSSKLVIRDRYNITRRRTVTVVSQTSGKTGERAFFLSLHAPHAWERFQTELKLFCCYSTI